MKQLICLLLPVLAVPAFFENAVSLEKSAPQAALAPETLVIFPFQNVTGSSAVYLEGYLPELVARSLPAGKHLVIIDSRKAAFEMKKRGLTGGDLYDGEGALELAKHIGARIAITGRFLHEGKSLKVNCRSINVETGQSVSGDEFSHTGGDSILDAAAQCAVKAAEWVKTESLPDIMARIETEKLTPLRDLYAHMRGTKPGIVFRNKWLSSLLIASCFYLLSLLVKLLFDKVIYRLTARSATNVDDDIAMAARKPFRWILIFVGFKLALLPLGLTPALYGALNNLFTSAIIFMVGYFLMKLSEILLGAWGSGVARKLDSRINDDLVPLFTKVSKIFIIIITALIVLAKFGIEIGPLIASLGIAGFAIGFAVKDTLSNIIGGIILTLDQSFAVGDKVSIDGDVGVIREVGLRNTQILTYDNEVVIIPNGELMNKKFKNYALPTPNIRVVVDFGVAYGSDVDRVEEVVLAALNAVKDIQTAPAPEVFFVSMGDFSLNFQARFWISLYGNQFAKKVEATKALYRALTEAGIGIPFPTHTVYLEKNS